MSLSATSRQLTAFILLTALATIGGALVLEHGFGLQPCPLCLRQRYPYYLAVAVALAALLLPPRARKLALSSLVLIFLASAGLGVHHAGVEWGFWPGPNDCAAPAPPAADMGDFLRQLDKARVVSCTEAAWRFFGLSLAGWNVLISIGLAVAAFIAASFGNHEQRGRLLRRLPE